MAPVHTPRSSRCPVVAGLALLLLLLAVACAPSEPRIVSGEGPTTSTPEPTTPPVAGGWPPAVTLTPVLEGLEQPVLLTGAGDGSGRLFVVELTGRIRVARDGAVLAEPFLDLSALISTGGERGLLSLAFPADYATSGAFYVDYTDTAGDSVIARYRVSADPDRADATSAEVLLRVPQPYANHNGGQLAFGPDGALYVGFGDGGGAGDPEHNGQDPASLLGKLLRLDVTGPGAYRIPRDNPFMGDGTHRPEIWALGLRNPWRFSFDRATGDLYIADVGQNAWEEIDVEPAGAGGGRNYGWNRFEGTHPYPPDSVQDPAGVTMPVLEYDRAAGKSVTGGFVYRGTRSPELTGIYFYADYVSGRLWALRRSGESWENALVMETGLSVAGFGQDDAGEVYVLDMARGDVLRIDAE